MHRRRYLAAATALVFGSGCLDGTRPPEPGEGNRSIATTGGTTPTPSPTDTTERPSPTDTPAPTDPVIETFETPADSDWWTVELDSVDLLYTPDDSYVTSEDGLDRVGPVGTHHWSVATESRPQRLVSGGATLYYELGSRESELVARDVETGDEKWTDNLSYGRPLGTSDSAVFVGETTTDDLSTGGQPVFAIDADSGEERWHDDIGTQSDGVVSHELFLVPHYRGTLTAFDVTTGERRWEHVHDSDIQVVQVAGDTVYLLTDDEIGAYTLPGGDERWRRPLPRIQIGIAAAAPAADRTDTICTVNYDGTLHGIDAESGDAKWATDTPTDGQITSMPRGETTVVLDDDELLYGYDVASGEERWRQDMRPGAPITARAVIDGALVATTRGEDDEWRFLAFNEETGQRRWGRSFGDVESFAIAGGRIVVGTGDGTVYGSPVD